MQSGAGHAREHALKRFERQRPAVGLFDPPMALQTISELDMGNAGGIPGHGDNFRRLGQTAAEIALIMATDLDRRVFWAFS